MAKQIIVLEQSAPNLFNVAFWLAVPTVRQPFYVNAAATSRYKDASAPELAALQSGAVVEQVAEFSYPAGTAIGAVMALLQTEFATRQAKVTAANPWSRYGSFWDGTTWTNGGVA